MWNEKRASFLLGSVPLGPNFTGTGSPQAKILIPSIGSWPRYNFARPQNFFSIFGFQIATFGVLCGLFYGSVDCFGGRQSLHDSIMSVTVTGVIAGSWTEHALADNSERMSCEDHYIMCWHVGPYTIAGLSHFRCDASLIAEYRPYAASPWCWTVTLIPCATLLYSQKYMLQYRLVVFHSELHL